MQPYSIITFTFFFGISDPDLRVRPPLSAVLLADQFFRLSPDLGLDAGDLPVLPVGGDLDALFGFLFLLRPPLGRLSVVSMPSFSLLQVALLHLHFACLIHCRPVRLDHLSLLFHLPLVSSWLFSVVGHSADVHLSFVSFAFVVEHWICQN